MYRHTNVIPPAHKQAAIEPTLSAKTYRLGPTFSAEGPTVFANSPQTSSWAHIFCKQRPELSNQSFAGLPISGLLPSVRAPRFIYSLMGDGAFRICSFSRPNPRTIPDTVTIFLPNGSRREPPAVLPRVHHVRHCPGLSGRHTRWLVRVS